LWDWCLDSRFCSFLSCPHSKLKSSFKLSKQSFGTRFPHFSPCTLLKFKWEKKTHIHPAWTNKCIKTHFMYNHPPKKDECGATRVTWNFSPRSSWFVP
jgi:hypothetical protein